MATTTEFIKTRRVLELTFTLTYADTTAAKMFSLPSDVRIIGWFLNVTTAFSGGTTQINIGTTSASSNEIIAAQDVSSTGLQAVSTTLALPGYEPAALKDIYAVVGASNTAGAVKVTCVFSVPKAPPLA